MRYYEQDAQKVKEYLKNIRDIPPEKIVYVDETGIDKCLSREYRRSLKGTRVYGKIYGHRFERTNIVAAQQGKQIIAPLLAQDTVVIMDNASFHRKNCLNDIAKEYGIKIIFLPTYSHELNPIEHEDHVFGNPESV